MRPLFKEKEIQSLPIGECFKTSINHHECIVYRSGWGKISAAASAQYAIDHFHPDILCNLGTCGGFEGRVELGTIILVERTVVYDIQEQMTDQEQAVGAYSTELDLDWLPRTDLEHIRRGLMLSADRDILVEDIPELIERYSAITADWESGSIAWVANKNRVKCLILRGVTDLVGSQGGEAYGNYELYKQRTQDVMMALVTQLPDFLSLIHPERG